MTVTSVDKDFDNLTMTVVAEFGAPVERVWQLWADPRLLEQWWGPPTHPASVEKHDLTTGGEVTYFMTGPDGEKSRAWWRVVFADPPTFLEFVDGFAAKDGMPMEGVSTTRVRVTLAPHDGGTRMMVRSEFGSLEHMERLVRMGAMEVFVQTIGQMDALLAR